MAYEEPDLPVSGNEVSTSGFGFKVRNSIIWLKEQVDAAVYSIVSNRQGGSATDCTIPGTTNYTPTSCHIQNGTAEIPKFNTTYGYLDITFPVSFVGKPMVFVANIELNGIMTNAISITSTGCRLIYHVVDGGDPINLTVSWLAIYNP